MFKQSTVRRIMCAMVGATALAATAFGVDLAPGDSVSPVPLVTPPAGTTLLSTISRDFDLSDHTRATVVQYVYRLSDNTIAFRYSVDNNANSQNAIDFWTTRDFSDFTTDIFVEGGLGVTHWPSSASRTADGSSVRLNFGSGLPIGTLSRPVWILTNATSVYIPTGPIILNIGRVTVSDTVHAQTVMGFAFPVTDVSPPVISLAGPTPLACVCNPTAITGTAYDFGGFGNYVLEYSADPNGPWTTITTSTTPVQSNGVLGTWDTTAIAQGYYFLRLTATNSSAMTSSVTNIVFVDKQFDIVDIRSPLAGALLGGSVCVDGTVQDGNSSLCFNHFTTDYAPLPAGGPFLPVNPALPTYNQPVWTDTLGVWNTRSGGAAVADGNWRVRVVGTDDCGNTRTTTRDVSIDNTPPVVHIDSPSACVNLTGSVAILGGASDAHMGSWSLQYTGGDVHTWVTIASGSSNVSGVLGTWNTVGLRPCAYVLRLVASDAANVNCGVTSNQSEVLLAVSVGCLADFNRSGTVNSQDYFDFLTAFFAGC